MYHWLHKGSGSGVSLRFYPCTQKPRRGSKTGKKKVRLDINDRGSLAPRGKLRSARSAPIPDPSATWHSRRHALSVPGQTCFTAAFLPPRPHRFPLRGCRSLLPLLLHGPATPLRRCRPQAHIPQKLTVRHRSEQLHTVSIEHRFTQFMISNRPINPPCFGENEL